MKIGTEVNMIYPCDQPGPGEVKDVMYGLNKVQWPSGAWALLRDDELEEVQDGEDNPKQEG